MRRPAIDVAVRRQQPLGSILIQVVRVRLEPRAHIRCGGIRVGFPHAVHITAIALAWIREPDERIDEVLATGVAVRQLADIGKGVGGAGNAEPTQRRIAVVCGDGSMRMMVTQVAAAVDACVDDERCIVCEAMVVPQVLIDLRAVQNIEASPVLMRHIQRKAAYFLYACCC